MVVGRLAMDSATPEGTKNTTTSRPGVLQQARDRRLYTAPVAHQLDKRPRRLGLGSATVLIIGSTIGSGIFRSPAGIAQEVDDPSLFMALWVVGGSVAK